MNEPNGPPAHVVKSQQVAERETQRLLIKSAFDVRRLFGHRRTEYPVQTEPFRFQLTIKNLGKTPVNGGTISGVALSTGPSAAIRESLPATHAFGLINPNEETTVLLADGYVSQMAGPAWLTAAIMPSDSTVEFETYQEVGMKCPLSCNRWGTGLFIRPQIEAHQARTNKILVVLTVLIFLEGVLGLKVIAQAIIGRVGGAFGWVADLLRGIAG